jgi:GNAT superfamily N-acetyltransferase
VGVRILDVSLEELDRIPAECLETCFWELEDDLEGPDARFQKEEWFSSTLLEWGPCGKLAADPEVSEGFAQFGPATLFPRLGRFPAGDVSEDAIYLSYCYVVEGERGRGLGTLLVRAVARDLVDRGYVAVEAIGDRSWDGSWVLPAPFLAANGFVVVREDPRFPLMRLDLRAAEKPREAVEHAAVPLPSPAPAYGVA